MKELHKYTTEELKAEIKRRIDLAKKQVAEVMRCKHCEHFIDKGFGVYRCAVRIWGKKIVYHYAISKSKKACELFKKKEDENR